MSESFNVSISFFYELSEKLVRFCPIPKTENSVILKISYTLNYDTNSEILENSLLIQILTVENLKGCVTGQKEKTKTSELLILPYNQNRKLGNLEKFCFMHLIIYNFI